MRGLRRLQVPPIPSDGCAVDVAVRCAGDALTNRGSNAFHPWCCHLERLMPSPQPSSHRVLRQHPSHFSRATPKMSPPCSQLMVGKTDAAFGRSLRLTCGPLPPQHIRDVATSNAPRLGRAAHSSRAGASRVLPPEKRSGRGRPRSNS
jgi:hypothetical protein